MTRWSVTAHARITAAPDGRGGTALPELAGDGPLALRRSRDRVTVVGAMAAPLGGDRLRLDATVLAGARLRVGTAAATISLPGRDGAESVYDVTLTVEDRAVLHWLPEPLIAAAGSRLRTTTRVELAEGARLVLREEQVLGRSGEQPGALSTRLTVRRAGRPLLDQELSFGQAAPGWDGPAVLGGRRAVGQLLVVDPAFEDKPVAARLLDRDDGLDGSHASDGGDALVTPLAGPAALVTAVARDALTLRRLLDEGQREVVGAPW
ncbi:urease accessory protein UreD [Wenjunlia tyrosinilytica]|uniref:Urease accessory protein UreD n=1 Tax=Wenjunlia tyrosinilytica TaxID=1544741 RepID=A0A917ZK05_9ACTN|nr:urease accessory protein UreD [Wenjunlia tyrosinilytica]GGO83975.1 urease accessory protein UreD [Wenjunlia tyrosinilytica]